MKGRTRFVSVTAMLIALSTVLLYLASLLPTARIAVAAVAGLITAVAVIECGILSGVACFACTCALAIVLLPVKSTALLYTLFFGYYPVIKSLIERLNKRVMEWAVKILIFNAALTAAYLLWRFGFMPDIDFGAWLLILLYLAGNALFVLYDMAFSALAGQYVERIYKKR